MIMHSVPRFAFPFFPFLCRPRVTIAFIRSYRVRFLGSEALNSSTSSKMTKLWPAYENAAAVARFANRSKTTPRFQVKVNFLMDNHSLVMNSRREVMLRKNVLKATGITGLERDERGLPKMAGLLAGPSAPSGGAKSHSSHHQAAADGGGLVGGQSRVY